MKIRDVDDAKTKNDYIVFRRCLYKGDSGYVCTAEFVVEMFLNGSTAFARSCFVRPIMAYGDRVVAECMLIHNPRLPLMQVAFFEAEPNQQEAVDLLLEEARKEAIRLGVERIIVGLNGHISYGVGILVEGFQKATFDSLYNKPYYKGYFSCLAEHESLTAYRGAIADVQKYFSSRDGGITVRRANFGQFRKEMELFRNLCDRTIGTTHLYFPTEESHFYELMKDMLPFLREENILFAESYGTPVGFLFWHPDYNMVLHGGRSYGIAGIGLNYLLKRRAIDTVKVNAIGVLREFRGSCALALIAEMNRYVKGKYCFVETNFVWDNNVESSKLTSHLLGDGCRRYEVYAEEVTRL